MKRLLVVMAVVVAVVMVTGGGAQAESPPAPIAPGPMPANMPPAPPPIQLLPAAGATPPPADVIADPVTSSASCGGWYLQGSYGNRWPAGSSWWEYQCTDDEYSTSPPCVGACDAFCPYCWEQIQNTTDYFYWDGSNAVFYGQDYYYQFDYPQTDNPAQVSSAWWDAPTGEWWNLGPFALTVSSAGSGSGQVTENPQGAIVCTTDCEPSFDQGTVVTLTAAPDSGSTFTGWSGDCSGTGDCQVTVNQARSVTATFTANAFRLTVTKQGIGSGQVSSSPAGISSCNLICQASFDVGSTVTLTATAGAGSTFAGWSGDCTGSGGCQLTMSQARSVTATFVPKTFTLTVSKTGTGSGDVSSSPAGISCGSACQAVFATGSTVALTATPAAGSIFTGWTGDCTGGGSCQVTVDQAPSVTATFAPNLPPHAVLTIACLGLACTFTSGSTDPDGSIVNSVWALGDGTTGVGATITHTYAHAGSYTATLTVTDNAGATASTSKAFNPISLSARGYKQNGRGKVDLSWIGTSGTSFDVYRNGTKIGSASTSAYSDSVGTQRGSFMYTVCDTAGAFCSNTATVTF